MDLLVSTIQNYAWGDAGFIAELQGRRPSGDPEAELWMGAHPKAPSRLATADIGLDEHIAADPERALGHAVGFGGLPFLEKVLASAQPLSIQTHPDSDRARRGFARENDAGIPLDSPTRTYRDPNHKPELICALTAFDAKCGFRPIDQTIELFDQIGGDVVRPVIERLSQVGTEADVLADVLMWLLGASPDAAAELTNGIAHACISAADGPWNTEIGWTHRLQSLYPGDPGVVVALLLNHFTLEPGEALFLEAGVLHAYMQGSGIEIMANSDNVIRGGLTPKHVDIAELAEVVITQPAEPPVQVPGGAIHRFRSPVPEFELTRMEITMGITAPVTGPEILIVTNGQFTVTTESASFDVGPGQPIWVDAADAEWRARGEGTLFRASVPAV